MFVRTIWWYCRLVEVVVAVVVFVMVGEGVANVIAFIAMDITIVPFITRGADTSMVSAVPPGQRHG